ncbi:hypothetical protein [Actinoplanes sp. RD1]|uniref:hypothetical protein n=1 Tax=Actinoplanes sp. RD1 TaxID=3064538 RepID=UPI0027417F84|nr:hypothetical protein [Actinoplanes sp. RD1]
MSHRRVSAWFAAIVAAVVTLSALTLQSPAHAASNWIWNNSSGGLKVGVVHFLDGNYSIDNKYDIRLSPGGTTSAYWSTAAAAWIGPGYCARVFYTGGAVDGEVFVADYQDGTYIPANGRNFRIEAHGGDLC